MTGPRATTPRTTTRRTTVLWTTTGPHVVVRPDGRSRSRGTQPIRTLDVRGREVLARTASVVLVLLVLVGWSGRDPSPDPWSSVVGTAGPEPSPVAGPHP